MSLRSPPKTASGRRQKDMQPPISPSSDFGSSVGERLRILMQRQGRSLETLAAFSGLGKNKLDAVAMGEVAPTINLLWKIANALGVPFGSLIPVRKGRDGFILRKATKHVISSSDGGLTSRALLPHDSERPVEFYELTIAPEHIAASEAHGAGTRESIVVVRGSVEITVGKEPSQHLEEGDAMIFDGDVPHSYRNLGSSEALLYLVMSYINLGSPS
jgi:XRE family transcriptional regulator, regulator of sulfur utilization